MHKSVLIYNSDYKIVNAPEVKVEEQNLPTMTQTQQPQTFTTETIVDTSQNQTPVQTVQQTDYTNNSQPVKTIINKIVTPKSSTVSYTTDELDKYQQIVNRTNENIKKQIAQEKEKANENTRQQTSQKTVTIPVVKNQTPVKTTTTTPVKTTASTTPAQATQTAQTQTKKPAIRQMTAEEEEIAWNIWRSNLQNQIMRDSRLPNVPTGTIFKFSFSVDKYGKISKVQTWSTNSTYTPYAIQYIAPVIKGYQGRSILNFPGGSNRVTTTVNGGWKISTSAKYSTPQDYNDIETVNR